MKKYKTFINEKYYQFINEDDIQLPSFYDATGKKSYKGVKDYEFYQSIILINPLFSDRESKGVVSVFISNIGINNFNNRKNSVISTSSKQYASEWGSSIYEIIPEVDEIYISPGDDFNYIDNWSYLYSKIPNFGFSDFDFGEIISQIYYYLYGNNVLENISLEISEIGWDDSYLYNISKTIEYLEKDWDNIKNINIDFEGFVEKSKKVSLSMLKVSYDFIQVSKNYNSLQEMFSDLLDPDKNGFKKIKYSEYQKSNEYKNNEVWFNCKCILEIVIEKMGH